MLPWGVRNQEESGEVTPGTDPGAPALHRVWSKLDLDDGGRHRDFRRFVCRLYAGPYPVRLPDGDFRAAAPVAKPKKRAGRDALLMVLIVLVLDRYSFSRGGSGYRARTCFLPRLGPRKVGAGLPAGVPLIRIEDASRSIGRLSPIIYGTQRSITIGASSGIDRAALGATITRTVHMPGSASSIPPISQVPSACSTVVPVQRPDLPAFGGSSTKRTSFAGNSGDVFARNANSSPRRSPAWPGSIVTSAMASVVWM